MNGIEETLRTIKPAGGPAELLRAAAERPLRRGLMMTAADHGVKPGDYNRFRMASTAAVAEAFLKGDLPVARLAPRLKTPAVLVDFGVKGFPTRPGNCWAESVEVSLSTSGGGLKGTDDVTERAAMSREAALECLWQGAAAARRFIEAHAVELLGLGAFGVGGEVSSTVLAAVVAEKSVDEVIDANRRGSRELADAVQSALRRQSPDPLEAVDLLAAYGGLEIGGLAGAILGAAEMGVPAVLDGLSSLAAAAVAVDLAPSAAGYLIASTGRLSRASTALLDHLGLQPLLGFEPPLEDGSAALLGMELAEACQGVATETRLC